MRPTTSILALASLAAPGFAQDVDLALGPPETIKQVGEAVHIQLLTFATGVGSIDVAAIDAILDYDPTFLLLLGVDDTLASTDWLASSFLPDPDGLNADITDGQALYTALCQPGTPAVAPAAGAIVTTLEFVALAETPGTLVSLTPSAGAFGVTEVYEYGAANSPVTGDITTGAIVRIVPSPVGYCFGDPADCPCGNDGGPGAGCLNSTGSGARLLINGSSSLALDDFVLHASDVPAGQFGLFIVGGGQNDIPFGDGLRCVAPGPTGLHRFNPVALSSGSGTMTRGPGNAAYAQGNFPASGHLQPGETYYFQAWFRDPFGGPCGTNFNLTNGLGVVFTP